MCCSPPGFTELMMSLWIDAGIILAVVVLNAQLP
jgi:hypothetical protein